MTEVHPYEILDAADAYLVEHGWCQGHLYDDQGRACLMGALCAAYQQASQRGCTPQSFSRANVAVREQIRIILGGPLTFPDYNDIVAESEADIHTLLAEASRYAKERWA